MPVLTQLLGLCLPTRILRAGRKTRTFSSRLSTPLRRAGREARWFGLRLPTLLREAGRETRLMSLQASGATRRPTRMQFT
ncbi:protein of unknown function [Hyphomicrobium sp. MC1]|nr:protein of unknown function [Hyphomicrobium sp. MC1]